MKIINYVIGKDNKSKIFFDIFTRFSNFLSLEHTEEYYLIVSEKPEDNADIYHYHRPQFNGITHFPAVVTVHHDLCDTDLSLSEDVFLNEYRKADLVICLNTNQQNYLNHHGITNNTVIPHGFDKRLAALAEDFPPEKTSEKITIGYISKRYGRRVKGEVYLLNLLRRLDPQLIDLFFVGAGRREEAAQARKLGFDVKCFEYLPYSTLLSVYSKLDFLLMCSDSEGGPANVPEALGSKTHLLSFDIGISTDLLIDGKNGFILTGNVNDDSKLIASLLSQKNIISELKENWVTPPNLITWEQNFALHIKYYTEVIENFKNRETNLENDIVKLTSPPENISLIYRLPNIIRANDTLSTKITIVNNEKYFTEKDIYENNMYIALKGHSEKYGTSEIVRRRISQDLKLGLNTINFSTSISKEFSEVVFSFDLLCDHLGWFNCQNEEKAIKIV